MSTRIYIFLVYLLSTFVRINATTYYISNSLGNDSNSGLSLQNPIKTISKLNTFNFFPGDSILFKSQDTFYGCLLYTSPSPRDMRRSRMPSSA